MQAERQLEHYQTELKQGHWRTIFIACVTTLVASFLIARLVVPSSVWQLTDQQIQYLSFGQEVSMVWPNLSKKERDHLTDVADKIGK